MPVCKEKDHVFGGLFDVISLYYSTLRRKSQYLGDDIEQMSLFDEDDFLRGGDEFFDVFVFEGERLDFCFVVEVGGRDGEFGAEFAVDLDDDFDGVTFEDGFVPSWPFVVGF